MTKEPQSKDEALEALDFIVNVLKEHERDLDRLIGELSSVTEQVAGVAGLSAKVEKIEQRVCALHDDVTNIASFLSTSSRAPLVLGKEQKTEALAVKTEGSAQLPVQGSRIILKCKQWVDFQNFAYQAQALSFTFKEAEKTFQVYAVKDNQIVTYSGVLPELPALLKMWLCKQLDVSEEKVLEGVLAIG
ncbi:MAG: hypothetical protein QXU99_03990 [Candidatus Bathyarchaeia archaeon]